MPNGVFQSFFMVCCQATADTKPIERFMTKAKSHSACDPRAISALRVLQNYKTRSARIILKFFMENTSNSKKRKKSVTVDRKNLFIFQMFMIKLKNWIIPFKLAQLLVTHDGGRLTRVGELSSAERLQGSQCNPLARVTLAHIDKCMRRLQPNLVVKSLDLLFDHDCILSKPKANPI